MFWAVAGAAALVVAIIYIVLDIIIHSLKVGHITKKYVFITGCDTGFGHLAAKQLDKLGFHVFAGCLTKEGAKSVTESCSSRVTTVELDIRSTQSIQQAVELVKSKLPPNTGLWALINNAGIAGLMAPAEMCSREDVQETLSVNLLGPIDMTRHFLPLIRKSQGRIVNTTSVSGRVAIIPTPYSVSKFGLEGFSTRLRREVWPQGIKVSIVEPGAFRTPIMNIEKLVGDVQEAFDKHSPDIQAVYGGHELMKKETAIAMFWTVAGAAVLTVIILYYVLDTFMHSLRIDNMTEKYVFITGCDSGFGHLAAKQLDKLGFHVFAGCLTKEGAKSVTESCSSRVTTVELDIRSTKSIQQAVKQVESRLPPDTGIWALINNAGIIGLMAPAEMCSREDVQEVLSVNLLGPIDVTRHFLPLVRKAKGRIVNTSSIGGRVAAVSIPYTVSKFGLHGFTDRLRREVLQQGIKVSIIEPGAFRTPMVNVDKIVQDVQEAFDKHSPDIQAVYGGSELMNRVRAFYSSIKTSSNADTGPVIKAYIHAVAVKYPLRRYVPGWDARWFFTALSFLPDSIADLMLGPAA